MRLLLALMLCLWTTLAFAQTGFVGYGTAPYGTVTWSRFQEGQVSRITNFQTRVFMSEGQWQRFWKELTGEPAANAPRGLDWNTEQLIVVCLGERSTGGYSVQVQNIRGQDASRAIVEWCEIAPMSRQPVTQAKTQPWCAVRMKRLPVTLGFSQVSPPRPIQTGGGGHGYGYRDPYGYGQYPCPIRWSMVYDGMRCNVNRSTTYTICSPNEFLQYWDYAFGRTPVDRKLLESVQWSDEILVAFHCGMPARGTVGIDSVMLDANGRVSIRWYEKLQPNGMNLGMDCQPFMIIRIPRYTTSPSIFKLLGQPR